MEDEKNHFWLGNFISSLVLGLLLTGVAFVLFKNAGPTNEPKGGPIAIMSTTSSTASLLASMTTTTILLGVSAPKAVSDKLFSLTLPSAAIEEQIVPSGWRWTSLREPSDVRIQSGKDGTLFLVGSGWYVPLRLRNGRALDETHLVGRLDNQRVVLSARDDGRAVYLVTKVGEIRNVFSLSDTMSVLGLSGGDIWISTFQPGPGIESPPQGPSSLIRVTQSGATSTFMTDARVITSAMVEPDDPTMVAVTFDTGEMSLVLNGVTKWSLDAMPLGWIGPSLDRLLLARGTSILLFGFENAPTAVATLPFAASFAMVSSTK